MQYRQCDVRTTPDIPLRFALKIVERYGVASYVRCIEEVTHTAMTSIEPWQGKPGLLPPEGQDFWVFGYGSLIWRPGFPHVEVRTGLLRGYHRRFCLYSHLYRGTPECPGLVLGLARGGSCRGLIFRVPAAEGETVMEYLYEREMAMGTYHPRWLTVDADIGRVAAAGFVVDTTHPQFAGKLSERETARLIRQGHGKGGSCVEYLRNTVHHLEALEMHDHALHSLLRRVEADEQPDDRRAREDGAVPS